MLVSGALLPQRGAIFPSLKSTGFWDRQPKRTPGRFRRMLMGKPFPQSYPLPEQIREKASVTAHLPKGFLARQYKTVAATPILAV
jgi:hypothetical protein